MLKLNKVFNQMLIKQMQLINLYNQMIHLNKGNKLKNKQNKIKMIDGINLNNRIIKVRPNIVNLMNFKIINKKMISLQKIIM